MIYEIRSYDIVPGRMPAMNARFQNHTMGLFKKHGIEVVGFWEAMIGASNVLHYIVRFSDLGHRERAWAAFGADPEWLRVRAESEKDGPIVARIRNEIWRPSWRWGGSGRAHSGSTSIETWTSCSTQSRRSDCLQGSATLACANCTSSSPKKGSPRLRTSSSASPVTCGPLRSAATAILPVRESAPFCRRSSHVNPSSAARRSAPGCLAALSLRRSRSCRHNPRPT